MLIREESVGAYLKGRRVFPPSCLSRRERLETGNETQPPRTVNGAEDVSVVRLRREGRGMSGFAEVGDKAT